MRICIYGAGAIGGHAAARLIAQGEAEVSIIARGPHLEAIRANGIRLHSEGRTFGGRPVAATDDPAQLPPQDCVIVALKAHGLSAIAAPLARLLKPEGFAVFAVNGIPWWWNYGLHTERGPLPLLDPDGALWRDLGPQRALGCVIYSANVVTAPGVITHPVTSRTWQIGEPDGRSSPRAQALVDVLARADLHASVVPDIRKALLRKLCTNIFANAVGALTRLTRRDAGPVPDLNRIAETAIDEMLTVARAEGFDLRGEVDPRMIVAPADPRGGPSSMLQDVLAGRALECDAILGQVQAFGRETGTPTPTLDVILALLRGLDRSLALARDKPSA